MSSDDALIAIVRTGIGHSQVPISSEVDWADVLFRAKRHGLAALGMDGIVASGIELPKDVSRLWMAEMVKVEARYAKGEMVIRNLAAEFSLAEIPMMIIKGFGLSLNYPIPSHRPTGDVDIWNFGLQEYADKFIEDRTGVKIDNGVHHHSVFVFHGLTVENHYDFLNVHSHRSNARLEKMLKAMVSSPEQCIQYEKADNVYLPPMDFNALYLLRHMAAHFAAEKVNLRQILDWGLFVRAHDGGLDWNDLVVLAEDFNMNAFLGCIDAICVEELGFDPALFPDIPFDRSLKKRILDDILDTRSSAPRPGILHVGQRIRRWAGNSWKHKIVYNESLAETFLAQTVAHLMKPASFNH